MAELFANPLADEVVISLISAGLYFLVGILLLSILMKFVNSFMKDKEVVQMLSRVGIGKHQTDMIISGIKIYLYFILFLIILGRLGISSLLTDFVIFILILSVLGIMLLSMKNVMPNAAAGLYISSTRMIKKGDEVIIDKHEGTVEEINLLNTVLSRSKNEKIIIPNALIIKSKVVKK